MAGSVLILTGPPGAGKSTVADILATTSQQPSAHLHTDDFYDRYIKSGYVLPWLLESQRQNETVTNAIAAAATEYACGGYFTIIDGVVGPWFLGSYRAAARAKNIALDYIVLRPQSADIAFARVQQRATHGLKAERPVRDLYRQFSDLGEFERHAFDAGTLSAEETADAIRDGLAAERYRLR